MQARIINDVTVNGANHATDVLVLVSLALPLLLIGSSRCGTPA